MPKDFEKLWLTQWKVRIEYDNNENPLYIGEAKSGIATSATGWRIKKITYDSNNNPIQIDWADGNTNMDNVWDGRASYSYS